MTDKLRYYWRKVFFLGIAYLFWIINLFSLRKRKAIVIFHPLKLGDLICATGVFREVKKAFPDHKLIVIARQTFSRVLTNSPYIDELISFNNDQQTKQYLWLVNTASRLRKQYRPRYFLNLSTDFEVNVFGMILGASQRLGVITKQDGKLQKLVYPLYQKFEYDYKQQMKERFFDMLSSLGVKVENQKNEIFFPGEIEEVESFVKKKGHSSSDLIVGIYLASGKSFKMWPKEYWVELLNKLVTTHRAKFLFFGFSGEEGDIEDVVSKVKGKHDVLINKYPDVMPYYFKKCKLFIGVDTGPLYMADAMHVPVVDIIGPCDSETQRPDNDHKLVTNKDLCRPISKILLTPGKEHHQEMTDCFKSISVEQVYQACEELLGSK